jgi:valyl-tRNA synthetase
MNLPEDFEYTGSDGKNLNIEDKWVLSKLNTLIKEVTHNLDCFELGVAAAKIYDFIWDIYCDWYIELAKPRIAAGGETMRTAQNILILVMKDMLKLLHPFMPFITEEIWGVLPELNALEKKPVMLQEYPRADGERARYESEGARFEKVMAAIRGIRARRAEMNVPPSVKTKLFVETADIEAFSLGRLFFERLAYASSVETASGFDAAKVGGAVAVVTDSARIFIPLSELTDKEKESARLKKEKAAAEKDVAFSEGKLNNRGFISKAPAAQIEEEREKLARAKEKLAKIEKSLEALS